MSASIMRSRTRLPLVLRICLLAVVCAPSWVAAQTTAATATRWDIFGATGGNATDPDPVVQQELREQATRNIGGMARDAAGVAGPAGSIWLAARNPNVRLGRLDPSASPSASAYTEWRIFNVNPQDNESGVVGGLAINPTTDGGNPFRGDVWLSVQGTPSFVLKLGDAPDTFRKWVIGTWILAPRGIAASAVTGMAYAAADTNIPTDAGLDRGLIVQIQRDPGAPMYSWGSGDIQPRYVSVVPSPAGGDIVWFTNAKNNTLARLDLSALELTLPLTEWQLTGLNPTGLHVNGSEVCVVSQGASGASNGEVECVDTIANTRTRFTPAPGLDLPQQLARTASGEFFVTEQGSTPTSPGNAVIFVGAQAVQGMPEEVTPTVSTVDFFQLEVAGGGDFVIPPTLVDLAFTPESFATVALTGENIGNGHVRFPLPLLPQTDLEALDRFPQPNAISDAFNVTGPGTGTVFVAESFDGPIGPFRGARIDRFELVAAQAIIDVCAPQSTCGVSTLALSATVGDPSVTRSFFVKNAGTGPLGWEAAASSSDFAISVAPFLGSVSGTETDEVIVTVMSIPPEGGTYTGTITVSSPSGADSVTLDVVLTVSNTTADIEVASSYPLPLAFSTNQNGTLDPKSFTVKNRLGGLDLSWATEIEYLQGSNWLQIDPTGATNISDETTTVGVTIANYSSLSPGVYNATIHVTTNDDPDEPSTPVDVRLTITAPTIEIDTDPSTPAVDVTPLFFADATQGDEPTKTVILRNTGDGPLTATVTPNVAWLAPVAPVFLPPGGEALITLTVLSQLLPVGGPHAATITFADPVATNPAPPSIGASITILSGATIALDPESINLGSLPKGTTEIPADRTVTVSNTGALSMTFTATVEDGSWMSVVADQTTVPAGGSVPITLTFSSVADLPFGINTIKVKVASAEAGNSPRYVTVTLNIAGGRFEVPATLDLGHVLHGKNPSPSTRAIVVNNVGSADLNFTASWTGGTWLSGLPTGNTLVAVGQSTTLNVNVDSAALASTTHSGDIVLTDPIAENSPAKVVVTLIVDPAPAIDFGGVTGLAFTWVPGVGSIPADGHALNIRNTGDLVLNAKFESAPGANWFQTGWSTNTAGPGQFLPPLSIVLDQVKLANLLALGQLSPDRLIPGDTYTSFVTIRDLVLDVSRQMPVTLTVGFPAAIGVTPAALTFTSKRGQNPAQQTITVTNTAATPGAPLNLMVQTSESWLNVVAPELITLAPGQASPFNVLVNASTLAVGSYTATITLVDRDPAVQPKTITVSVTIQPGAFTLAPSQLTFQATRWTTCNAVASGSNPATQTIVVTNPSDHRVWFTAEAATTTGGPWLSARKAVFVVPRHRSIRIEVAIDARGLAAGAYGGAVTISALSGRPPRTNDDDNDDDGDNDDDRDDDDRDHRNPRDPVVVTEFDTVPVLLNVGPAPATLCVSPLTLDFGALPSNTTSGPLEVRIQNVGDEALGAWSVTPSPLKPGYGSVNLSASTGSGPASVFASITTTNNDGPQTAKLTIAAPGAMKTPQQVLVTFVVLPDAFTVAPTTLTFQASRWTTCNAETSGSNPSQKTIVVTNLSNQHVWYSAAVATTTGGPWLSARQTLFSIPPHRTQTVEVAVDARGLAAGVYDGTITLAAWSGRPQGGGGAVVLRSETVPVALNVGPAPATLCVSPLALDFGTLLTNTTSASLGVLIQNVGDSALGAWSATPSYLKADYGKINLSATSGSGPASLMVSITTKQKEGTQSATITIAAPGAAKTPQVVSLEWKVKKPKPPSNHQHGDDQCWGDHDGDNDHDDNDHRRHRHGDDD